MIPDRHQSGPGTFPAPTIASVYQNLYRLSPSWVSSAPADTGRRNDASSRSSPAAQASTTTSSSSSSSEPPRRLQHGFAACSADEGAGGASGQYDGLTFGRHMIAGATAGVVEHVTMFPIDTVKTRMQALSHPGQQLRGASLSSAIKVIVRREGFMSLYSGVTAVAMGAGPSHALYFASYELSKDLLGGNGGGHRPAEAALAGAMATAVNDLFMTPWDVVKQRLQVEGTPYKGVMDCVRQTWRLQGPAAFFKSYRTTLVMNVPFVSIFFPVYESGKKLLNSGDNEDDEGLLVQMAAGGVAGGVAAWLTNPLDVVKTRLQTEGVHSRVQYSASEWKTLKMIVKTEGSRALWSGSKARVLFHIPAAAIQWATYESMKALLVKNGS